MEIVLTLIVMIAFEFVFDFLFKYIRYNIPKLQFTVYILLILYTFFFFELLETTSNELIGFIYRIGIAQGELDIISFILKTRKYKSKKNIINTFKNNFCRILSLDWIEDYNDDELELLEKMNYTMEGKNGKVNLLIIKDKSKKQIKLMFFVYKKGDWKCIEEFCEQHCNIEINKQNNRKQSIICTLNT